MDLIPYDKTLILIAFLAALCLLWLGVVRYKGGIVATLGQGRRLRVTETASLGASDRALILTVDDREFLLLKVKGAGLVLHPLSVTDKAKP